MSANNYEQRDDYKAIVKNAALDEKTFLKLTLSKKLNEDATPWIKISVRPVLIKGHRQMQFSYFDPKKNITKNFTEDELQKHLDEVLTLPFTQIHVQSTSGDIHIRITQKGKVLISRGKSSRKELEPILLHNRVKRYPLSANSPDAFLEAIGIMDKQGKVKYSMQGKFKQINEFLRIVQQAVTNNHLAQQPIHIVDCGCGNAYLTFAAYYYLSQVCSLPVYLVGIDKNEEIISQCRRLRDSLGWSGLEFQMSSIVEFVPVVPPDMVLSLHACDTATDEAIAQGIFWGSRVILAAPCCQHELHCQLKAPLFQPVLRHGILKERLADLLTDTFRALVLRIMGYRTSVFQFVSPEHTSKNLMIKAERGLEPGHTASVQEYKALKNFWHVSLFIEQLLGEEIQRFLGTL
ncbi:SAM-dependent methyltransferase [Candidatus Poribacteria bacterium]|nr:SAM-dependent methyltransferase [Candidatus Poribacteria bacterium]